MTQEEMADLQYGDLILSPNLDTYMVVKNYGDKALVARTTEITNPSGWGLVENRRIEKND